MGTRRMRAGAGALLGAFVCGCPPASSPGGAPAPVAPTPEAPPVAPAPEAPRPPDVATPPEPPPPPAPEARPPRPAPPTPPPPPGALPPPGEDPPAAPAEEGELLKRGARRRLGDDRAVALSEVLPASDGAPACARLDVAVGATHLQALLPVGGRVEVGGMTLEVLALEPKAIRLRLRAGAPPDAPLRPLEEGGPRLRLAGLGLYALPDGVRIGVGNVRHEGRGPTARDCVTLTVFPASYASDPTQGYDLHLDATAGQALEGQVRRGRVVALDAAAGTVELELLPPG